MSQIDRYLSPQKMEDLRATALQKAEEEFRQETTEERGRRKPGWSQYEKWTVLWATEFSKRKFSSNKSAQYTKMWRNIMEKYCPDKKNHANNTSQLANIKKNGVFSDQMTYLTEKVELLIEQQKDPLAEQSQSI